MLEKGMFVVAIYYQKKGGKQYNKLKAKYSGSQVVQHEEGYHSEKHVI